MAYKIQRLGLGGILDQAIAITKDHFGLLFSIMLLLLVPFSLVQGFVLLAMMPQMPAEPTMDDFVRMQEAQMANLPIIGVFGVLYFFLVLPLTNGAVIQAVARLYLGQPVTAVEAMKHAFTRLLPLIGTSILMMLAIMGGFILFIIPGIYFSIWFGLSQHVAVLEGISGPAALGRSKRLVHPQRGTFLALMIVMFAITFAVTFAAEMIPQLHVKLIVQTLLTAVTTILWTAAGVVFYFSCRCVVDNFDLQYLAETIGAEPTPELEGAGVPAGQGVR